MPRLPVTVTVSYVDGTWEWPARVQQKNRDGGGGGGTISSEASVSWVRYGPLLLRTKRLRRVESSVPYLDPGSIWEQSLL
jgi:hypothetical protein